MIDYRKKYLTLKRNAKDVLRERCHLENGWWRFVNREKAFREYLATGEWPMPF